MLAPWTLSSEDVMDSTEFSTYIAPPPSIAVLLKSVTSWMNARADVVMYWCGVEVGMRCWWKA